MSRNAASERMNVFMGVEFARKIEPIDRQGKPFSLASLRNSLRSVRPIARDARERFLRVALLSCFHFSLAAYHSACFQSRQSIRPP